MKKLQIWLLSIFTFALFSNTTGAQTSWHYLQNTNLTTIQFRFEDVYFTDSVTGFAVSLDGHIYKTKNAGRDWAETFSSTQKIPFRSIEFLDDGVTGIAGCLDSTSAYRSTDKGEHWVPVTNNIQPRSLNGDYICGLAHWGNTFYGVGWWGSPRAHIYKSTDKGLTWQSITLDTTLATGLVDICFLTQNTGFATGTGGLGNTVFHPARESVILKTTDGGATWNKVFSDTLIGGRIWKIQALSSQLLVGSIEPYFNDTIAMVKSMDGGNTWSVIGTGFKKPAASLSGYGNQGIGFVTPLHGWLGGYYPGLFETKDGGQTWDSLAFGGNFNRFFVLDSTHLFAGGQAVYFFGKNVPDEVPGQLSSASHTHTLYDISPNPATGTVKIEFDLSVNTQIVLEVANTDARRTWPVTSAFLKKGHYTYYWNSAGAAAGNYMVWLGTNEIPVVKKFTLLK